MPTDPVVLKLAEAIGLLVESKSKSPLQLLDRLQAAQNRMDEAISKVDTMAELWKFLGDGLVDMVIEAARQYIKKAGPLGLAEATLKGVKGVSDFLGGDK